MRAIPVAQFPDIVPPQVQVITRYPGASASVVEATVAQPLEAQVNGADRMLYMKSNSANDGSYSLTVSFELGTNPDINTVNVNNRVQAALSRLPQGGAAAGCDGAEAFVGDTGVPGVLVRRRQAEPAVFISNYVTINVLDRLSRVSGVGSASCSGRWTIRCGFGSTPVGWTSLNLAPSDIIQAVAAAERAGRRWGGSARGRRRRHAVPDQPAHPGPADDDRGVRRHRGAGEPGRLGVAGARTWPGWS